MTDGLQTSATAAAAVTANSIFLPLGGAALTGTQADDHLHLYGAAATAASTTLTSTYVHTLQIQASARTIGGITPTLHILLNGVDIGHFTVASTPSGFKDSLGVDYSVRDVETFSVSGITAVSALKIVSDPVSVPGAPEPLTAGLFQLTIDGVEVLGALGVLPTVDPDSSVLLDPTAFNVAIQTQPGGIAGLPVQVDGGAGVDTLSVLGSAGAYAISTSNGVVQLREQAGLGQKADLVNVEQVKFFDYTVVFDLHSAEDRLVYELYQAAYGRTPDNAGFRYWAALADATNASATSLADSFMAAPEFTQLYGVNLDNRTFVGGLYAHVLGRGSDPSGLNYWTAQLDAGAARDQLLAAFATSPENLALVGAHTTNGYWTL